MTTPLVSIIIPVYNGSNYLNQAIDSALAQTYDNCEVIVINDGSADNGATESIAKSYGDRIKYHCKTNGGVASAMNAGIRLADGDYISWLSHDDLYLPHKIERQITFLSSLPSADVVLYSDYEVVDANNDFIRTVKLDALSGVDSIQAFILLLFRASVHGCSLLLPRKCFTEIGYFAENLRTTQDYDLWFKLLKNGYEFVHMPEVLMITRWHKEQGSHALYKIARREIDALYVAAVDMFYDDINRLQVTTIMELIVELRERRLGKTAKRILTSIKSRNKVLYKQLNDRYADQLFKSRLKLMTAKPLGIANAIMRRLGLRGGV